MDRRMEKQAGLHMLLFREDRLEKARSKLRPL